MKSRFVKMIREKVSDMVAMTRSNIDAMPIALEELAKQIQSPDDVPMLCLLDAAEMIRELRKCVADSVRRPLGVVPMSAAWITSEEVDTAEKRRVDYGRTDTETSVDF